MKAPAWTIATAGESMTRRSYTKTPEVPPELMERFAVVMATLGGTMSVSEGARQVGLSRVQFQTVVHRALGAVLDSLQPRVSGPKPVPEAERKLRERVQELEEELAEAKEQAAMFQRFLGVASDLMHGRIKTGRRSRKSKSTASTPETGTKEDPDPAEARRRDVVRWSERMRAVRVHPALVTALLGASPATRGRWRRRLAAGLPLRRRRTVTAVNVSPELRERIESHVRATRGLAGVESMRHSVAAGLPRRTIADIKRATTAAMERERKAGCARVEVIVPGVVRGFDAMEVRCAEGRRWVLVCTDAAVPRRTTMRLVAHYDSDQVLHVLLTDFVEHSTPLVLRMDRAACQRTPEVKQMLEHLGVRVLHGPPRRPQYYGQLERQNREHRAWLRDLQGAPEAVVVAALPQMQHALNALHARPSLGWRPAEVVWTSRPPLSDNARVRFASKVAHEVARHTGDDVDPTHAQRLGIEHALHEEGYLRVTKARRAN